MINSREVAFITIDEILFDKAYSNIALNQNIKKYNAYNDENFIRELVYGVVENKMYLEYILRKVSKIRIKKIHRRIYSIIVMGIYQIYFMDKVPGSAAVNESVNLAKKHGNKGSIGFVNGILRNIIRNKEELGKIDVNNDDIKYLSIRYSHPEWLVSNWVEEFGMDFTKSLCKANNDKPNFTVVYNKIKTSKGKLKTKFEKLGYVVEYSKISEDSLIIKNPKHIFMTREFENGLFNVQGEGSSLVAEVVGPTEGSLVLDVCAAPGGKAIHMAQRMNNKGVVKARDIHDHRLELINDNVKRLGIDIIDIEKFDATVLDETLINKVDFCLIDAPCSGLGTIRRSPEIKYNRTEEDIINLAQIQKKIIDVSKNYVKLGGMLIYSTCTIDSRENSDIIDKFLEENTNFELVLDPIKLYPNIDNTDGFFICKMKRIK